MGDYVFCACLKTNRRSFIVYVVTSFILPLKILFFHEKIMLRMESLLILVNLVEIDHP